jgi:uncharacterized protein YdeI (YjbR/CyaY-like superfamily)
MSMKLQQSSNNSISGGTVHKMPADFKGAILANKKALQAWEDITPLARNEWICWAITVKQQKTRDEHIMRATNQLAEGKRRPCCWIGCIHRTDKAISPSVKWALSKQSI